MDEKCPAALFSFGLFKVHFPAFEQHRREVYLLIYIDILISLHWFDADIHVSYSRLAQIIPVNENLKVFPPAILLLDRRKFVSKPWQHLTALTSMVSSEAYIGVTVNKLLNCVKSVYDRQSVTEIPSVRVEKVQKTFNLESGPLTYSHSDHKLLEAFHLVLECQCSRSQGRWHHRGLVFVTDLWFTVVHLSISDWVMRYHRLYAPKYSWDNKSGKWIGYFLGKSLSWHIMAVLQQGWFHCRSPGLVTRWRRNEPPNIFGDHHSATGPMSPVYWTLTD